MSGEPAFRRYRFDPELDTVQFQRGTIGGWARFRYLNRYDYRLLEEMGIIKWAEFAKYNWCGS